MRVRTVSWFSCVVSGLVGRSVHWLVGRSVSHAARPSWALCTFLSRGGGGVRGGGKLEGGMGDSFSFFLSVCSVATWLNASRDAQISARTTGQLCLFFET